jgi:hypothetical protein
MKAKTRHKKRMLEYWSNPANVFISRTEMREKILHLSSPTFYQHFPPDELTQIENEAATARRERYARERSEVVQAMYNEGKNGNVSAAKEFLDRTEGKVPDKKQISGPDGGPVEITHTVIDVKKAENVFNSPKI